MPLRRSRWAHGAVAMLLAAAPLSAQSITSGSIEGTVRGDDGRAIAQAIVAVTPVGAGSSYEATTTSSGTFSLGVVQPGSYEIRVEALGYRPLVARVLTVAGGERSSLALTLTASPPPVLLVDTIALGAGSSTRWRAGGVQLGGLEIDQPHRFDDLASIVSLSSAFDASLGSQGLPGDMTLIIADGVPFYRAAHPVARSELVPDALFPRSALSGVGAIHAGADVQLAGSAGGYVTLATRSATAGGGVELEGAYSGDPVWSSSELDFDTPSLVSYQGAARGTVEVTPGVSQLTLAGEGLSHQTPLAPRVGETLAAELAGLDDDLLTSLTEPAVETYTRYSGLARFDAQRSATSRIFARVGAAFVTRDFDGAGPVSLAREAAPAEESIDYSFAGGVVSDQSTNMQLELRAGFSGSSRELGAAMDDRAPAYLVGAGAALGNILSAPAETSRTDFVLLPALHYTLGSGSTVGFGASVRVSSHTMDYSPAGGSLFYSDAAALVAGRGYAVSASASEESFGTQEYGAFVQYESTLAPGVRMVVGGRYDLERISADGPARNIDWLAATGLDNAAHPASFHQLGARASLTWSPGTAGDTRVFITGSLHEGDLDTRAIYELLSEDVGATSSRFMGTGLDWPAATAPDVGPDRPMLTLLGPDTRAPRSTNVAAGIMQRVGPGVAVYVRGSMRRTDFLMRRRNLNLPATAQAADPDGRGIFGTLEQDGALITTTSDDARRFAQFGDAWALDPDGWSEYMGFTAGIEHGSPALDLYGSYTYSETTDNWVGAAGAAIGGELRPGLPDSDEGDWSEGISDFDVPHRMAAGVTVRFGPAALSGVYRFRSGLPFTPRYRLGVDANGDGSIRNDVAHVPGDAQLVMLMDDWPCLENRAGMFAVRNSCRGPERHGVDARLRIALGHLAGRAAYLTLDGFNLVEDGGGVIDDALWLVDADGAITTNGSTVSLPLELNPNFGQVLYPSTRGRMLRIGVRVGG